MKKNYKLIATIPVIITLLALVVIFVNGLNQSIDVSGGTEITILANNVNINDLKSQLPAGAEIRTMKSSSGTYVIITLSKNINSDNVNEILKNYFKVDDLNKLQYSQKEIGAALSGQFWKSSFTAVGFAFIFMAVVVWAIFRTPIPSGAIVLAAISDIIIAVAGMSIFGIPVSTATVAALLMLLGYSVDTDIMLTTKVLKRRKGSLDDRIKDAMKTGITMSITTIFAMFVLYCVVTFMVPAAGLLKNIAAVILFGLIADLMTTWMTNVGILRYYVEEYKKNKVKK